MRKETKVGLALVALLLGVFCFVLYKRIQGRNREAAETLAQQQADISAETTQVTAKPVLDDAPGPRSADAGASQTGLMAQAWRKPAGQVHAPHEQQPSGNEARFAQSQPAAVDSGASSAVDPFAARVARSVDPISADPSHTAEVSETANAANPADDARDAAAATADDRYPTGDRYAADERLQADDQRVGNAASNQDDVADSHSADELRSRLTGAGSKVADSYDDAATYATADLQPVPGQRSTPGEQPPTVPHTAADAADLPAEDLARDLPADRIGRGEPRGNETFQPADAYADVQRYQHSEPSTADGPYAMTDDRAAPADGVRSDTDLRYAGRQGSEAPQPSYAARPLEDEPPADTFRDQYSPGPTAGQMNGSRGDYAEPAYRGAAEQDDPYERPPVRGSFAAARFVAQGRPAVAEEVADPAAYGGGGDRWQPERNAAAPASQAGPARQQPYYENRSAAGAAPQGPPAAAPRGQYTVQPNDSFWSISRKLYGDGGFFKALAEHNRRKFPETRNLKVGDVVSAPAAEDLRKAYPDLCPKLRQAAATTGRTVSAQQRMNAGRIYVVEEGDTLFDIARHELGTPARWVEIFELNADRLSNDFDYIRPGIELVLPADPAHAREARPRENVTRRPGGTPQR